jgi:hypothetical protein
LETFRRKK